MSDLTATCKVTLKPEAAHFLQSLPTPVKCALIDFIRTEARRADKQMVVKSWTLDLPDHIYRTFKWYAERPGIRAIFYRTHDGLTIVRIAWRCDDPYLDSH